MNMGFSMPRGLGNITNRMAEIATDLGVDIRLETSVEELCSMVRRS